MDGHVRGLKPRLEGDFEVLRHEERRVPPYIPEPLGPPSANEWLPFVSVGAGQRGNEGVLMAYADAFLEKGLITSEVEAFAQAAVRELPDSSTPLDRVRAVYTAVQHKLSGRDAGLSVSAAASVAQDRGSRVWLLKASLEALAFEVRLVAASPPSRRTLPLTSFPTRTAAYICLRRRFPMVSRCGSTLGSLRTLRELPSLPWWPRGLRAPEPGRPPEDPDARARPQSGRP